MIKLQEIASRLSIKHNLPISQIEIFLNAFVKTILVNLEKSDTVKIKGLGTFKVVKVKDRESVNVNTGERYIIYGHDKITFSPDSLMKELVNKPFSQFDTVVLKDGVSFDDIEEKQSEEDDTEVIENVDEIIHEIVQSTDEENIDDVEIKSDVNDNEQDEVLPTEGDINVVIDGHLQNNADDISIEDESFLNENESINEDFISSEVDDKNIQLKKENVEEKILEDIHTEEEANVEHNTMSNFVPEYDYDTEVLSNGSSGKKKTLIFTILALVIGFIGGYLFGHYLIPSSPAVVYIEQDIDSIATNENSFNREKIINKTKHNEEQNDNSAHNEETKTLEYNINKQQSISENKKTESVLAKNADEQIVDKQSEYEAKYVAIRYGAYRIEGVSQTVTVAKGQTLKSISRAHLGSDMECYVIAINDGKTEVKQGDKLKIPKLKLKKKFKK